MAASEKGVKSKVDTNGSISVGAGAGLVVNRAGKIKPDVWKHFQYNCPEYIIHNFGSGLNLLGNCHAGPTR